MKQIFFLTLFLISIFSGYSQETKLFPIIENNLCGYINSKGEIIIKPQFKYAYPFSEQLAAVRKNGLYGYINVTGDFVIPAKYDFALDFHNGIAEVFVKSKKELIDTKGEKLFDHNFKELIYSTAERSEKTFIVKTNSGKFGLIDSNGILISDTIFKKMTLFTNGYSVVSGINDNPYAKKGEKEVSEVGLINMRGEFIVPFGKYYYFRQTNDGLTSVGVLGSWKEKFEDNAMSYFVNTNGEDVIKLKKEIFPKYWNFKFEAFNCNRNIIVISLDDDEKDTLDFYPFLQENYYGIIDTNFKVVKVNKDIIDITSFSSNRAFAKGKDGYWQLIDLQGSVVNNNKFKDIKFTCYNPNNSIGNQDIFVDGTAFVELDSCIALIDTNGNILRKSDIYDFCCNGYRVNNYLFFSRNSTKEEDYIDYWGFWNADKNILIKPKFHNIEIADFHSKPLLSVYLNDLLGYVNDSGIYIWKENPKEMDSLNIDFMLRGYNYAYSKSKKNSKSHNTYGGSYTRPQKINKYLKTNSNNIEIKLDTSIRNTFSRYYHGISLYIFNRTPNDIKFKTQDNRLYLNLQAKDSSGQWRDIEYLPKSWCGNSYYSVVLNSNHYWKFIVPIYSGEIKTTIRAILKINDFNDIEKELIIYSNEIDGYINPAQFWRRQDYNAKSIMDPYDE